MRSTLMLSVAMAFMMTLPAAAATMANSAKATGMHAGKGETVEERITSLHDELRITPQEEGRWNDVAQAMRENAANMEKMVADKQAQNPDAMTAKDDLRNYQRFAQAHVDGLKNLRSSFDSLYDFMPPAQQQVADQVFAKSRQ